MPLWAQLVIAGISLGREFFKWLSEREETERKQDIEDFMKFKKAITVARKEKRTDEISKMFEALGISNDNAGVSDEGKK